MNFRLMCFSYGSHSLPANLGDVLCLMRLSSTFWDHFTRLLAPQNCWMRIIHHQLMLQQLRRSKVFSWSNSYSSSYWTYFLYFEVSVSFALCWLKWSEILWVQCLSCVQLLHSDPFCETFYLSYFGWSSLYLDLCNSSLFVGRSAQLINWSFCESGM